MSENLEINETTETMQGLPTVDSHNLEAGRLSFAQSHSSKVCQYAKILIHSWFVSFFSARIDPFQLLLYLKVQWRKIMSLAFQSLEVVYGDLGTSPLYVFSNTFPNGIGNWNDILGVLSLIIYSIILLPFIKYTFIVLRANEKGEGMKKYNLHMVWYIYDDCFLLVVAETKTWIEHRAEYTSLDKVSLGTRFDKY